MIHIIIATVNCSDKRKKSLRNTNLWEAERSLSNREQQRYLVQEVRAVAAQLRVQATPGYVDTGGLNQEPSLTSRQGRQRFVAALEHLASACVETDDQETIRVCLRALQRYNSVFVSMILQRRRSWSADYSTIQTEPRLSLGEIHGFAPHAIAGVENLMAECDRKLSPFFGDLSLAPPLLLVVHSDNYSLTIPANMKGLLPSPREILSSPDTDVALARSQLARHLDLCYVTCPRWVPATLRYGTMVAHEQMHRLLLLFEPLLAVNATEAESSSAVLAKFVPKECMELLGTAMEFGVPMLGKCCVGLESDVPATHYVPMMTHLIELLADVGALALVGPSYALALAFELERGELDGVAPIHHYHPNALMRLLLLHRVLQESGYSEEARVLDERIRTLESDSADRIQRLAGIPSRQSALAAASSWKGYASRFAEFMKGDETVFDDFINNLVRSAESNRWMCYIGGTINGRDVGPHHRTRWQELRRQVEVGASVHYSESPAEILNVMWQHELERIRNPSPGDGPRLRFTYRSAMFHAELPSEK